MSDHPALSPELQQLRILIKGDIDAAIDRSMEAAAQQFETVGEQLEDVRDTLEPLGTDVKDLQATTGRIERRLNAIGDQVDGHGVRLKSLERAA